MKVEDHEQAYKEHIRNINRSIEEGIEENQRNLGFNISQGSVELISIYLHKLNLIQSSGDQLDHRIFKSNSLSEKRLPIDFPEKQTILAIMRKIEEERNVVCYGKRKPNDRIEKIILLFNKLREIVNKGINKNGKK